MKSDNGVFDPIFVGVGFLVIIVSALVCGAAALKVLFTDFNQPAQVVNQDIQLTENRCWVWCNAGGNKHE